MAKVFLSLSFLLSGFTFVYAQYTLDDVLLEFRRDYVSYKTKSIRNLDDSFFKVYDGLHRKLLEILDPYFKFGIFWNKVCSKTPVDLQKSSANQQENLCRVINSTTNLVAPMISNGMTSFFSGQLGAPSVFENIANGVFSIVEETMNWIPQIYFVSSSCVKKILSHHSEAYTPAIDAIFVVANRSMKSFNNIFLNATKASQMAAIVFQNLTEGYKFCMKGKFSSECIKYMVCKYVLVWLNYTFNLLRNFADYR